VTAYSALSIHAVTRKKFMSANNIFPKLSRGRVNSKHVHNSMQTRWSGWCCDQAGRHLWGREVCDTPNCRQIGRWPAASGWHWYWRISAS